MSEISEIEKYFAQLLANKEYSDEHILSDDKLRFEKYDELKQKFSQIAANLNNMRPEVRNHFADYLKYIEHLIDGFLKLSKISNSDLDNYLRSMSINNIIKEDETAHIGLLFHNMVEELIGFFLQSGDKIVMLLRKTFADFNQIKIADDAAMKQDEEEYFKRLVLANINFYRLADEILKESKAGIIAKDKKMLLLLRNIKTTEAKSEEVSVERKANLSSTMAKNKITKKIDKILTQENEDDGLYRE